jgi:hypothetical protein
MQTCTALQCCCSMSEAHRCHTSASSSESSPTPSNAWTVQDIIAERKSLNGDKELLVIWKPSWIPKENMADGPVWRSFRGARRCQFSCAAGSIIVPVEAGSSLAADIATVTRQVSANPLVSASGGIAAERKRDMTPKKSLSTDPKRVRQ